MFKVVRYSGMSGKAERVISEHRKFERAWRAAHKLNEEALADFRQGRHMYDTPEYKVE